MKETTCLDCVYCKRDPNSFDYNSTNETIECDYPMPAPISMFYKFIWIGNGKECAVMKTKLDLRNEIINNKE